MERSSVERILRESMEARLVLRILYRSGDGQATERDIEARDIQGGYCRAWCHLRHEMRTFRVDRIEDARMLADGFVPDWEGIGWGTAGQQTAPQSNSSTNESPKHSVLFGRGTE
ncbi:MAG: WYL domain-containing protein [bacterium]|nr:WYL domain-containing protein [bacterium]